MKTKLRQGIKKRKEKGRKGERTKRKTRYSTKMRETGEYQVLILINYAIYSTIQGDRDITTGSL